MKLKFEIYIGSGTEQGDQFYFSFFGLTKKLPIFQKEDDYTDIFQKWGFSRFDRDIHFSWGFKTKIIDLPWSYGCCVYSKVLSWDNEWIDNEGKDYNSKRLDSFLDDRSHATYPYTYRLKNGEVQNVMATIYVDRRIWTWKIFHFLPNFLLPIIPFKIDQKCISVEFNSEVGEKSGSWKGGTIGCGYKMKNNETPYQTLRRMEIEREF